MTLPSSSSLRVPLTGADKVAWLIAVIMGSVFLVPMAADAVLGLALLWLLLRDPEAAESIGRITRDRLFWCGLALLLYLGCSVFWSPGVDWQGAGQIWLRLAFIIGFTLAVAASLGQLPACGTRICHAVILGVLVCTAITLTWFYLAPPEGGRLQGLFRFNNPGRAGPMYAATLPFALCAIQLERGRWRLLGACALVAAIVAVLLTDTRAAWLTAVIAILVHVIATLQRDSLRFTGILVFCCALALLFAVWAAEDPALRSLLFPRGGSFRYEIWRAHFNDALQGNYWFGWGQLVDHWVVVDRWEFRGGHNMYLSLFGHGGVLGLLLFLSTLLWIGCRLLRHLELPQARIGIALLLAGSGAFFLNGDRIIDNVNFIWFVLWYPMGIALAAPGAVSHSAKARPTPGVSGN